MADSLINASYEALKMLGKDSTSKEILDIINQRDLYPKRKLYDTMSVSTPIDMEIKNEGSNSRFLKKGPKTYGLKEFQYFVIRESDAHFDSWDIYITTKLNEVLSSTDKNDFCRCMNNLFDFLIKWKGTSVIECDLHSMRRKYPIILGTEEEVKKKRVAFDRINGDICTSKLELIRLVSSSEICDNFDSIHNLLESLESLCERNDRYAFYRPRRCKSDVVCHEVIFNKEKEYILKKGEAHIIKCSISPEMVIVDSGFIMMPYDTDSNYIFTPKFYQAICHELFHAQVIDIYRGSKSINEGLPELYSEICYFQFVENFIKELKIDQIDDTNQFKQSYMKFRTQGSYKRYYKFVTKELEFTNEAKVETGFFDFSNFICRLLRLSIEQIRKEYKPENPDIPILECGDLTPYWQYVFERACNEFKKCYKKF